MTKDSATAEEDYRYESGSHRLAAVTVTIISGIMIRRWEAYGMIPDTDEARHDLLKLKGMVYHPGVSLLAPFTPFLVHLTQPATLLVLLLPALDFFNLPGRLSRKYIPVYGHWYALLFLLSVICRLILEFVGVIYWTIPIIVVPIVFVVWAKFAWVEWWKLFRAAQNLDGS